MIALLASLVLLTSTDPTPLKKIVVDSSTNHILDTRYRRLQLPARLETPYYSQLRERVQKQFDVSNMQEVESLLAMTAWVSKQWKHDGRNGPPAGMNACQILDKAAKGTRWNCDGYARVLSDVLIAHGIVARTVQLRTTDQAYGGLGQGHIAVEAWSNILQKWVFLDPQLNGFMVQDGKLLTAFEASKLIRNGHRDSVQFLCTGLPPDKYEDFLVKHFGYLITMIRNEGHESLLTIALDGKEQFLTFQGLPASGTEFTTRRGDFYPVVNETSLSYYFDETVGYDSVMRRYEVRTKDDYVKAMPKFAPVPKFRIALENNMPWFDHYEVSIDGKMWTIVRGSDFHWTLHEGENRINVRSVNSRLQAGPITVMHIAYGVEKGDRSIPGAAGASH